LAAVRRMPALAAQLPLTLHLTRPRDPHGRFKVVVLSGGTGVGKTALSLQLAKELDGEIVSADSMQVYQGLNIGTAKASREEMSSVPHHLIDFIPLGGPDYSAARFHRDAMAKIKVRLEAPTADPYRAPRRNKPSCPHNIDTHVCSRNHA
jgi:DNA polymerase III delta prime subunit